MIGLLTPYAVQNYGTKLQAYAVQEIISEFDDVEIINFRPNLPERVKRKIEKKLQGNRYADIKGMEDFGIVSEEKLLERKNAINSFDVKLKIMPQIYGFKKLKLTSQKYSAVVCGSDQIWNPVNLPEHVFMLEFVPKKVRRVAFAPSFGISEIPNELKSEYKKRLRNIEYMSVREETGCRIVSELGFNDVTWSLDPTLVLDENKWYELANENKINIQEKYIFCYFLGSHALGRKIAREIKRITGFKIVNVPHFKGFVKEDENFADFDFYDVAPQDFIGLIKNAAYVCTDSFHGTAFSIIFQKQFLCCERHQTKDTGNTNDRIYSILKLIGQEKRLITGDNKVKETISKNINYTDVKNIINKNRIEVKKFLTQALKGARK
ncbi:MAG: polysaccharide pyruvyl transferase family protein [Candidatus Gastranaerophilaceae bacterium]